MTEDEIKALQAGKHLSLKAEATQRAELEAKSNKLDKLHADNVSLCREAGRSWPSDPGSKAGCGGHSDAVASGDKPVEVCRRRHPHPCWLRRLRRCWTALQPVLNFGEHATKDRVDTDIKTTSAGVC